MRPVAGLDSPIARGGQSSGGRFKGDGRIYAHSGSPVAKKSNGGAESRPRAVHLMRSLDYSCYAGASALLSTPSDLVRFGMAINNGKLLRPATVQSLQTPQRLTSGEETG